jgi:hypothetical protein
MLSFDVMFISNYLLCFGEFAAFCLQSLCSNKRVFFLTLNVDAAMYSATHIKIYKSKLRVVLEAFSFLISHPANLNFKL